MDAGNRVDASNNVDASKRWMYSNSMEASISMDAGNRVDASNNVDASNRWMPSIMLRQIDLGKGKYEVDDNFHAWAPFSRLGGRGRVGWGRGYMYPIHTLLLYGSSLCLPVEKLI
jgi:hypothetical protein